MPKNKQPKPTPDIRVMFQIAAQVEGTSESVILMAGDEREAVMHVMRKTRRLLFQLNHSHPMIVEEYNFDWKLILGQRQ